MRSSKAQVQAPVHTIPDIKFEDQRLTSFAGAVILQALLKRLNLKERLARHLRRYNQSAVYGLHVMVLHLIVHLLLGFRRLRDRDYYCDDPLVCRVLGLKKIPDVSTMSRRFNSVDANSVRHVRRVNRELVLERLEHESLNRITLDYDGSVLTTRGHSEGTAVGFNRKRKGGRSYYPLFCTVAQTGQFFDFHHRPGNVHDSNGAKDFMLECNRQIRTYCPLAQLETRMDSAFFNESIICALNEEGVEFSASVPFERFPPLKALVESCDKWQRIDDTWAFHELDWKPKSWDDSFRMIAIRRRTTEQRKGPLQLDLFEPRSYKYEYKVIVTNKTLSARSVLLFHNGRGSQEGMIGEGKSCAQLDYIPMRRLAANQMFCATSIIAHNLGRELQMTRAPRAKRNTLKRAALWTFQSLNTIRRRIIQRAGRITYPAGRMTLTMGANARVQSELAHYLDVLNAAA